MDPFCNQGSFFPSTFSLSFLFSLSQILHRARFLLCIKGQIAWDAVMVLKVPVWHLQVTVVHIVFEVEMCSWPCKLTLSPIDKAQPDPITDIQIQTWVGQSYTDNMNGNKNSTPHIPQVHLTLNELELLVAAWCLSLGLSALCVYVCKWKMSCSEVIGNDMQHLHSRWVESALPSSVMMGMLDPVVTEAWRTKPCTGLLSGDDLSIPGGVKPEQ